MEHDTATIKDSCVLGSVLAKLVLIAAVLGAGPVSASETPAYWKDNGCAGCHGSPVGIGTFPTPIDNRLINNRILIGSTAFLAKDDVFVARLKEPNVLQMTLLANEGTSSNRDSVRQYLLDVLNAEMPTSLTDFPDTVIRGINSTKTLQIRNSRYLPLSFGVTISGEDSQDFEVSGCNLSDGAGGVVPAAHETTQGIYTPGVCELTVTFHPQPGATVTRTGSMEAVFSGNEGGDPVKPAIDLVGSARLALEASPTALDFTTTTPESKSLTITDRVGDRIRICRKDVSPFNGKTHYTFEPNSKFELTNDDCITAGSDTASAVMPRLLTVSVTFNPKSVTDPLNADLEIQRQDANGGALGDALSPIHLKGNAGPVLVVDALRLFGGVNVEMDGSAAADRAVTLFSRGNAALTFVPDPLDQSPFVIKDTALTADGCASVPLGGVSQEYTIVLGGCQAIDGLSRYTGEPAPSCVLTVHFNPSELGKRCAVLSINTNVGKSQVVLEGNGIHGPRLSVKEGTNPKNSGDELNFTSQRLKQVYPPRTLTLTNDGTLGDLEVKLPASDAVPGFEVLSNPPSSCSTLAPGESCNLNVRFAPTSTSQYAGTFDILVRMSGSSDAYTPFRVGVRGQGTDRAPVLTWRSAGDEVLSSLEFGEAVPGSPVERRILLSNAGPGSAQLGLINAVGIDGPSFPLERGLCGASEYLAENARCEVVLRFVPGTAGAKVATVQVVSDGNGPMELVLHGTGIAGAKPPTLTLSSLRGFESVTVGNASAPGEVTLASAGAYSLSVLGLEVSGPFRVDSRTCPPLPFVLPPASVCTVSVVFEPTEPGQATGALRVTTDSSAQPVELPLAGEAQAGPDLTNGGCSLASGDAGKDPTLWVLVLLAVAALIYRWRARQAQRRDDQQQADGP